MKKQTTKKKNPAIEEITEQLEQGVKDVFTSGKYAEYLAFISRFYNYSVNNSILIWMQNPEASLVAGFKAWKTKFNRTVKKGEKGIKILAPCPHTSKLICKDEDGNETEKEIHYTTFRTTYVFDISQTEGDEVPTICEMLSGDVERFEELVEALKAISPVPVCFETFDSKANGYYSDSEKRIVVQADRSEMQKLKTLIHELAHAILHNSENGEQKDAGRHVMEVQAESTAYTVCAALGLDTSDYSFGYIAGWSEGKEAKELTESMDVIRQTAKTILEALKAA